MRQFFSLLKWALLTLLLAPIAMYVTVLFINLQDTAPSTQSKQYLAQIAEIDHSLTLNQQDNAYIFTLGFDAAKDDSPMTTGLELKKVLLEKDLLNPVNRQQKPHYQLVQLPLESCLAEDDFLVVCKANLEQSSNLAKLLAKNHWLIERYQQLLQMPRWQDSPHFNADISAMPFQQLLLAQKLYLLDIYQNIDSTSAELIVAAIERDMLFWLKISSNTHILLNKMVSVSAISVNMQLGEVILSQPPIEPNIATLPTSWNKPMAAAVLSLNKAKLGEWIYFTRTIASAQADDVSADTASQIASSLLSPLMQNQDTANRYAAILTNSGIQTDCDQGLSIDGISSYIYNPLGKYILCTGMPSFNAYQMTLDKLEQQRQALITRLKI
ncbi:hypothetical protein [Shewanella sp. 10N.286.54.B9]|uniref:hypothetical protein n=1 Tax=Shewanella sp. 10N.286.54.B9 TaxID=3229719 RepID=UPI00355095B7